MFGTKRYSSLYLSALPILFCLLCSGCGSNRSSVLSSDALSQPQAQAVSQQISGAMVSAFTSALTSTAASQPDARPNLSTALKNFLPEASAGCTSTSTGQTCNVPVNYTGTCPGGGTIAVLGDVDGTLSNAGDGSIAAAFTVTPAMCSVSNLIVNGSPDVTVAGQLSFTGDAISFPVTLTEGGGFSYGPTPSGTCELNVTYSINSELVCTVSGTVCGHAVSGNC
jgi:hypothetical protein